MNQTYFLQHQQRVTKLGVKLHRIYISPTKREHEKEVKNWCHLQHLGSLISKFQSRQKNNAHVQSCRFRNLDTTFWGCFLATKSFGVSSYTQILQVDTIKNPPKRFIEEWTKECCREELTWVSWTPKHFVLDLKRGWPFKKPNFWECLIGVFQSYKLLGCDVMLFKWWEIEHLNSQSLFLQMSTKSPILHGMFTSAAAAAAAEVWICQVPTSDSRLVVAVLLGHNWLICWACEYFFLFWAWSRSCCTKNKHFTSSAIPIFRHLFSLPSSLSGNFLARNWVLKEMGETSIAGILWNFFGFGHKRRRLWATKKVPYDGAGLNVKVAVPADTTSSILTPAACWYGSGGVQVLLIHSQNSSKSIDSFLL